MKLLGLICVLIFGVADSTSINKPTDEIKESFTHHQVVPGVIKTTPEHVIKVEYKKANKLAHLGNELKPKEVAEAPTISYEADPKAFYTLLMVDPDAPSRKNPVNGEWEHWAVVNIPGSDVSKGQVLTSYQGPAPPKNTGLHRYVFLLFKQAGGKMEFHEPLKNGGGKDRAKFSAEKFAEKYKLGNPVGGNMFRAQFDDAAAAPPPK